MVARLLQAEADVLHEDDRGQSSVFHAASNGNLELVSDLISAGACVNKHDHEGISPLGAACQENHQRCAETLLEARADVNGHNADKLYFTPLMLACDAGQPTLVKLLIDYRANPSINRPETERDGKEVPRFAVEFAEACEQSGGAACVKMLKSYEQLREHEQRGKHTRTHARTRLQPALHTST